MLVYSIHLNNPKPAIITAFRTIFISITEVYLYFAVVKLIKEVC